MSDLRPVVGFEGRYLVSSAGEVYSLITGIKLRQQSLSAGYKTVPLTIANGKGAKKHELVHRLVALAFLPNPENKPQVNHKDGVRNNNSSSNLEWSTVSENLKHSYSQLGRKAHVETLIDTSRRCVCIKDGVVVGEYSSATEAARNLNLRNRGVSRAASGERKSYAGFEWRYIDT